MTDKLAENGYPAALATSLQQPDAEELMQKALKQVSGLCQLYCHVSLEGGNSRMVAVVDRL